MVPSGETLGTKPNWRKASARGADARCSSPPLRIPPSQYVQVNASPVRIPPSRRFSSSPALSHYQGVASSRPVFSGTGSVGQDTIVAQPLVDMASPGIGFPSAAAGSLHTRRILKQREDLPQVAEVIQLDALQRAHDELQEILSTMSSPGVPSKERSIQQRLEHLEANIGSLLDNHSHNQWQGREKPKESLSPGLTPARCQSPADSTVTVNPACGSTANDGSVEVQTFAGPADAAAGGPRAPAFPSRCSTRTNSTRSSPSRTSPSGRTRMADPKAWAEMQPVPPATLRGCMPSVVKAGKDIFPAFTAAPSSFRHSEHLPLWGRRQHEGTAANSLTGNGPDEEKYMEFIVRRLSREDRLGLDIRHGPLPGQLAIAKIEEGAALDRLNQQALSLDPPGEAMEVGDRIIEVNGITEPESRMVKELADKLELRIVVLRPLPVQGACNTNSE